MKSAVCLFLLLFLTGCAKQHIVPAPQAIRVPDLKNAARDASNGVVAIVQTDQWHGDPGNLRDALTPVYVRLENKSRHPLEIAYRRFALTTDSGMTSTALPPFSIRGSVEQTVPVTTYDPWYGWNGFYLSPYYPG